VGLLERNAAAGAAVWLVVAGAALAERGPFWLIEVLFLLAPLVLVPLALARLGLTGRLWASLQPVAALAATGAFLLARGPEAAALALPWFVFTLLLAGRGLQRLRRQGMADAAESAFTAALLYVPVGAGWLIASRLGLEPMGFQEPIVLLTAVHFHHAGFVALVVTGLCARALAPSLPRRAAVGGVIAGTPLLAAGITFSPALELAAAVVLALSLAGMACALLTRVVRRAFPPAAAGLLAVAASSSLVAMAFALAYAWGEFSERPLVSLAQVARIHGCANALGFGLCGLLGFALDRRTAR
jgi:hypothetical protein